MSRKHLPPELAKVHRELRWSKALRVACLIGTGFATFCAVAAMIMSQNPLMYGMSAGSFLIGWLAAGRWEHDAMLRWLSLCPCPNCAEYRRSQGRK